MSGLMNTQNNKLKSTITLTGRLTACLLVSTAMVMTAMPAHATNALGDPASRVTAKGGVLGGLKAVEAETKAGDITVGSTTQVVVKFRNESSRRTFVSARSACTRHRRSAQTWH